VSDRYPLPIPEVSAGAMAAAYTAAARRTLDRLAARPDRPAALRAFDELMGGDGRWKELEQRSEPVVGGVCNFVPEELVLALGAIPLRVELGLPEAAEAGARALCSDVCPAVRCLAGARLGQLPLLRSCDLLVIPSACDGKKKLVRALGPEPEVFLLELPVDKDSADGQARWRKQIDALATRLERLTGRSLRRGPLRQAVEALNRRSQLSRRLEALRRERPGVLSGGDALLVMQASFLADPGWWEEKTTALLDELARAPEPAAAPVRLLLTGSPLLFPDLRLLELCEGSGRAVVVADLMCSGAERLHHPHVVDEPTVGGLLRGAADRTLLPCACPCFVDGQDRIDRLLELWRASQAQGVIHHTLRLCQPFDLELPRLRAALRQHGVPLLEVSAEPSGEGAAALQNRIDAFLEMLDTAL
jgi:benzoyl-CoA reductase/2-hydroxyglutaryl-CoA dehydratase subunit BcrC/BadD/HgdB